MLYFLVYVAIMSAITFTLYYLDKKRSLEGGYRISRKTLLLMSFLGGAAGGYLAMNIFRHKTRIWYFNVVNILSIVLHIAVALAFLFWF